MGVIMKKRKLQNELQALFQFIDNSPTAYHATANLEKMLDDAGYVRLEEKEKWGIRPG